MTFSVLICTYNRPHLLARSLAALIEDTTEKPDQVIIVNGGGEDTDQVVHSFIGRPGVKIRLVKTVNINLAASRNVGLPYCTGDIIAMTDDDALVFPDWVTRMKQAHSEHPEAGAVGGQVIGLDQGCLLSCVADRATFPSGEKPGYVRTLPGVNISYKCEVVKQVGLQDEALFRGEDVDYNWRIQRLGYKIYYDPAIKVYHDHRPTFHSFIHQHYMYGRAYYRVRRKWPDMHSVYPHGLRKPKDAIKLLNFFAGILYVPLMLSVRMPRLHWKPLAFVLLVVQDLAWKGGMLQQAWLDSRARTALGNREAGRADSGVE